MVFDFLFGGEQVVAVEVNSHRTWGVGVVREPRSIQKIRLIGDVGGNGIDLAVDQILWLEAMFYAGDASEGNALLLEIGEQLIRLGFDHQAFARQIVDSLDGTLWTGDQDHGRMLKNGRQHHHRVAGVARKDEAAVANAIVSLPVEYVFDRVIARSCLLNGDVQSRIAVVALFLGGVITGKLEGVVPFELEGDRIQRMRVRRPSAQKYLDRS